jgi:hypothetical protein
MKTVNETILAEAREASAEYERKYQEYLLKLEEEERLLEEFNEKRDSLLARLHEAFGFESRKELIKALRQIGKVETPETPETPEGEVTTEENTEVVS